MASDNLKIAFVGWIFSNPMTLGYLFGVGNILLGNPTTGLLWASCRRRMHRSHALGDP